MQTSSEETLDGDVKTAPQTINLDINRTGFFIMVWLASVSVLIVVMMFRQAEAPHFRAAVVNPDKMVSQARLHIQNKARFPEFVEVELVEFIKEIQSELDALADDPKISLVVNQNTVLSGDYEDYTDFVYLRALDAYTDGLEGRVNMTGEKDELSALKLGMVRP